MAVHNDRKEWKIIMRYTDFYNMFKDYLNGNQITEMQKMAFKFYKDAHGYNPMRKNQKQVAYGFLQDLFYNMESDECIDCLVKYGVDYKRAEAFWQSLEWIKGE